MNVLLVALLALTAQVNCPDGKVCVPVASAASGRSTIVFDVEPPDGEVWLGSTKLAGHQVQSHTPNSSYTAVVKWRRDGKVIERAVKTPPAAAGQTIHVAAQIPIPQPTIEGGVPEKDGVNFGIRVDQLPHGPEMFQLNGQPVGRGHGIAAVGSTLPDDRKLMRLTVTGSPEFRKQVVEDLAKPNSSPVRERLLVQTYTDQAWAVKDAGFKPGNQIYLQAPDGTVLHRQEDYAGGSEKLFEAIRKADSNYRPERDPDLRNDAGGGDAALILIGLLAAGLIVLKS